MNDTQVTKRKIGRMIAKNLIVMLVAVIVALTGVLAWFSSNTTAEATGINVKCKVPDGIEFAVVAKGAEPVESDYIKDNANFFTLNKENCSFLENLTLSEITSDGVTFYKPLLNQTGGIANPDTRAQAKWNQANPNESYLSFDVYFRSKESYTIYMNQGSYFLAQSEVQGSSLTGADAGNISSFGNFSKDCIVGASRLSIVSDDDVTLKCLWIPRPDIKFSSDAGNTVATGVESGDTYEHYYYTNCDSTTAEKIKTEFTDNLITSAFDEDTNQYVLPEKVELTTLTDRQADGYFYNHVTYNIWIDGEDSEARLALVNGQFVVNIDLTIN